MTILVDTQIRKYPKEAAFTATHQLILKTSLLKQGEKTMRLPISWTD